MAPPIAVSARQQDNGRLLDGGALATLRYLVPFYDVVGFNVHPSRPVPYRSEKVILFPSIGENVVHDVHQRGYRTSRSLCRMLGDGLSHSSIFLI